MFTTSTPLQSPANSLPSLLRQRSIEMLDLTHLHSKSFEDLQDAKQTKEKIFLRRSRSVSDVGRRRCFSAEAPLQDSRSPPLCFSVSPMTSALDHIDENGTADRLMYPRSFASHGTHAFPHIRDKDVLNDSIPSIPQITIETSSVFPDLPILQEETPVSPNTDCDDAVDLIRNGARFVQFAVGAYGTNFLKIMVYLILTPGNRKTSI